MAAYFGQKWVFSKGQTVSMQSKQPHTPLNYPPHIMSAQELLDIVRPPRGGETGGQLAEQHDLLRWLKSQRTTSRVVLYGSAYGSGSVFVHSVLAPASSLGCDWKALPEWEGNPFDSPSCGLVYGGGKDPRIEYTAPWSDRHEALSDAQQLVFGRSFEGLHGEKCYFELTQRITHAHDLHWVEERQAWCRLNNEGDVVDLAGVEQIERGQGGRAATFVWFDRELLEMHMSATDTCLVQMFDSTRIPSDFTGFDGGEEKVFVDVAAGLSYKFHITGISSYFRGVQIIRPARTATELGALLYAKEYGPKEYETFLTHDFKNQRLVECSCAPAAMASYFDKGSPLPFQTSPVFFKATVLDKYKADLDKYRIEDRSITCRNSWHLQTYDVNDAGQVHTMITYLGNLPLSEQRYWKAFNEPPKAPISRRSFKTDFEGTFDLEPDGLRDLKDILNKLGEGGQPWFTLRQPSLVAQLHYPLTAATKPWDDTLIGLAKCAVEGLEKQQMVKLATDAGKQGDPAWGSIKWLREALLARGVDEDRAEEIVSPFFELQQLRTKLAAHSSGAEATAIRQKLLREYGSPRAQVESIAARLAHSLEALSALFQA